MGFPRAAHPPAEVTQERCGARTVKRDSDRVLEPWRNPRRSTVLSAGWPRGGVVSPRAGRRGGRPERSNRKTRPQRGASWATRAGTGDSGGATPTNHSCCCARGSTGLLSPVCAGLALMCTRAVATLPCAT
jgi:hypothetical protein